MSKEQAKAEAEKIKELHLMFLLRLPFDKDVITENEHGKWTYSSEELANEHCIIHVKGILEEIDMYKGELNPRWEFWQSILTHLQSA